MIAYMSTFDVTVALGCAAYTTVTFRILVQVVDSERLFRIVGVPAGDYAYICLAVGFSH